MITISDETSHIITIDFEDDHIIFKFINDINDLMRFKYTLETYRIRVHFYMNKPAALQYRIIEQIVDYYNETYNI